MRTEDGYIIHKCLNGDPAAFGLLVDKYKASIYALAYSKLRNFHDAEDITQEAFIKAYQKLRTLRWWDNFLAWLYAITSNLCTDWIRSQSKRPDREFVADQDPYILDHPSVNSYREGLMRESLYEALDSLPETYRQVLTLYYLGGMSTREIARFLRTSPNAIAQRLGRARAKLKEEMIAMMSATYEQQRLKADFTFRIVELVKRMKIQPVPRTPWLPWGLSVATGIIIAVLSFTSPLISFNPAHIGSSGSAGERAKLPSHHLVMDETSSAPYSQSSEMLTYANVPVTLETIPGGNDQSRTAKPPGASLSDQGSDQTPQPEQTLLAAAAPGVTTDAEEKIIVSGKVLRDDAPVPNARVYIYNRSTETKQESTTEADGSFQLEIPKPGDKEWERSALTAVAQHPQHSFGWTKLSKDNTANVVIKLHRPVKITGTLADQGGNPIQGAEARVSVISFPKAGDPRGDFLLGGAVPISAAKTDAGGHFAIDNLPEGSDVNLDITGSGYARERKFSIRAGTEELMFILKPEGRIEGRVTFGETGKPAEGIKISAQGIYPTSGWTEAYTDEDGDYALTNLSAGDYDVGLGEAIPDWTAAAREYVKVAEGQTVENTDLTLVKGGFITGRVTDKDTNEPIPDHWIGFHDAARPESQAAIFSATTDENGSYSFRAAPGRAMVYTSAPKGYDDVGQVKKYVDVVEGETVSNADFQFQKSYTLTLTGTVLSFEGEPVAGAVITGRIERFERYGMSDKDGKFTITGLRPGQKFSVRAEQGELQLRGYADLEAQPGAEVEILVERYETTSVSGRVVSQQGEPIPSANIDLMRWDREMQRGTGTSAGMANSSGEYRIMGLIVGDEYRVSAKAEGYREAGTEMFTPTEDMAPLPDIVLPPTGSFFLEGTVTDTNGDPVARARVTPSSVRSIEEGMARTDENGHYRLDNLAFAVEVEISIDHPDYGHSRFQYVPTNQTQDFVIAKAHGYLAGKVVDADGNPVGNPSVFVDPQTRPGTWGHVNVGAWSNAQGQFRMENLLVDEKASVYVGKGKLYKIFQDVEMNRDDVVFVLEEEEPSEPPKPPTAEEIAKREYRKSADERFKELKGKPAPELDVAQWLHGKPTTMAELKGKVVVLHFWATQIIRRSVEAIGLLNALQKIYGEESLICIGIHEFTTQIDELKKLIEEKGATYSIAVDKESSVASAKGVTSDKYAIARLPSFILIDGEGVIHGRIWDHELEEKIQELLSD